MCGIIGYIGDKNIDKVLLSALSKLEYRGYDSAGMATVNEGAISLLRQTGKLRALKELAQKTPVEGRIGIGHTRWATHGVPAERNAHPHTDCSQQIAVVHNGIIENHAALRKQLLAEGHSFLSETDTEVLSHLLEKFHIHEGQDLETAVKSLLKVIEGSYAFCVISSKDSERFIAARNGSPLVIGVGQGENFVASDATAFLDHTRDAIFLDDYQMAVVSRTGTVISSTRGKDVQHRVTRIEWDAKDASKEGFDHFMLKEIEEQPRVIERMLRSRIQNGAIQLFDALHFDVQELTKIERIVIQACGTSWHAALTGKFLFEGIAGIPVEVDVSSEFRYRYLVRQPNTLVISITQSGETIDTLMGLRRAKELGYKTLAVCNVLGSTIARESDGVIYTHAGPEIGVASTKAYTAQLGVLTLLSLYFGKLRGALTSSETEDLLRDFQELPEKMKRVIAAKHQIKEVAQKYFSARDFLFLGRGINYPNAHEGALKIKEIAYVHATGHPAGEMKHGPIALIDAEMPVVAIAPRSALYEKMASNIQEVKARSGKIIAIATEGDETVRSFSDDVISIPETNEFMSPFLVALPLQYLAYYVATLRGTDVDQPRNLAKSVTVE
jgi:glucosamine--fructose-6-phosphate aminotransferase (isomerizing)